MTLLYKTGTASVNGGFMAMKLCKYCQTSMQGECETNPHNTRRFTGFYVCPACKAICEEDVEQREQSVRRRFERWWNPETKNWD